MKTKDKQRFIVSQNPYILHLGTVHNELTDRWFVCLYQAVGHKIYIEEEVGGPGGVLTMIQDTSLYTMIFRFMEAEGLLKEPFLPTGIVKQRDL